MKFRHLIASSFVVATILTSCASDDIPVIENPEPGTPVVPELVVDLNDPDSFDSVAAVAEAQLLLASIEADGGTPFDVDAASPFDASHNVFIPSTLGVDYRLSGNGRTSITPSATLPMFKGWETTDSGEVREAFYVITESSDEAQARELGIIFAPRMAQAKGSEGVQLGTWTEDGRLLFEGSVDFSGIRALEVGTEGRDDPDNPNFGLLSFPPASATPGAVASDAWSSYVVLPSGVVINAQEVGNETGRHDRVAVLDTGESGQDDFDNPNFSPETASVALVLLDGWQDGEQFYFHIVTDTNDMGASAIEKGVFAPRLSNIPTFGNFPGGAFLPFSPCVNGNPEPTEDGLIQGLNVASDSENQDQDPTNTFPIDPDDASLEYTPMWDAHLVEWGNDVALEDRIILTSFEDVTSERDAGRLGSFRGNATGPNPGHFDLSSAGATINCPVISQPTAASVAAGDVVGVNLTDI